MAKHCRHDLMTKFVDNDLYIYKCDDCDFIDFNTIITINGKNAPGNSIRTEFNFSIPYKGFDKVICYPKLVYDDGDSFLTYEIQLYNTSCKKVVITTNNSFLTLDDVDDAIYFLNNDSFIKKNMYKDFNTSSLRGISIKEMFSILHNNIYYFIDMHDQYRYFFYDNVNGYIGDLTKPLFKIKDKISCEKLLNQFLATLLLK